MKARGLSLGHSKAFALPSLAAVHTRCPGIGICLVGCSFLSQSQHRNFASHASHSNERAERLKPVLFRNSKFREFAESLVPRDWEDHIKVILPQIEAQARQIWPNCTVELHGSVARNVHDRYDSHIDIAIHSKGSCHEREISPRSLFSNL